MFRYPSFIKCDKLTVKAIVSKQSIHPSVQKIKEDFTLQKEFVLPSASTEEISKIIKSITADEATGSDCFLVKFVRMSEDITASHLTNIVN